MNCKNYNLFRTKNLPQVKPKYHSSGKILSLHNNYLTACIPNTKIGDICRVGTYANDYAQAIGFRSNLTEFALLSKCKNLKVGSKIINQQQNGQFVFPNKLLGKILNCTGQLLSQKNLINQNLYLSIDNKPPNPLERKKSNKVFSTGIEAIDTLLTLEHGQRIGIFAEAGTGKSTLLSQIAQNSQANVNVIALIGERGQEVNEFLNSLSEETLKKSVIVVSTSDEAALARKIAAQTATSIAEYYRHKGKEVLLLMDSLTRLARAIREVGLMSGEIPIRQGYTPSVYMELPQLFERTGKDRNGSITAIYTVLCNSENDIDPLTEEVKSLLDGHIILNKDLAEQDIFPAIDFLRSISRSARKFQSKRLQNKIRTLKAILKQLIENKALFAFSSEKDEELKQAIEFENKFYKLVSDNPKNFSQELSQIVDQVEGK